MFIPFNSSSTTIMAAIIDIDHKHALSHEVFVHVQTHCYGIEAITLQWY